MTLPLQGEIITADMKLGDIVLLGNLIPHCTTEKRSEDVRWSLDLRWQDPALPSNGLRMVRK